MGDSRKEMPVWVGHESDWKGLYLHLDANGDLEDRHRANLSCQLPGPDPHQDYQTNTHCPATYRDKAIWCDTERICGRAWQIDPRTDTLTWRRKDLPDSDLYDMFRLSENDRESAGTWHWLVGDKLIRRILIKERRAPKGISDQH